MRLHDVEERYRRIVDTSHDLIWSVDTDGRITFINRAARRVYGREPEEMIDHLFTEFVPADERRATMNVLLRLVSSGEEVAGHTIRACRKDGSVMVLSSTAAPLRDEQGRIVGVLGTSVDLTEPRALDETAQDNLANFRELAENIQDVFYHYDPQQRRMLYVSPAYETVWGRSRASLYGSAETFLGDIHPDDVQFVVQASLRHRAGAPTDIEYRIVRPDGAIRWIRDHAYPASAEAGRAVRVVGIARDVTEYKRTGDKIREQASLLDSARDAIVVRDLEHRVTYWNKSAERLYGIGAEDVLGRPVPEIFNKDPERFERAFEQLLLKGEWAGEMEQTNQRGEPLTVESRWTLVRDLTGEPKSVLVINTDITERRALEQRFLRAQRLESLGTLAGGIAHDLNNVLTPITIALELLIETERDRHSQELLATAMTSAKRGAQMVAQVLSFARGMEGRRELIDARELINDIEKIVHDTFPKSIAIETRLGPDLWNLVGDSTQLQQVLLNLCVNARDAMPGGGRLSITAENAILVPQDTAMHGDARPGPQVVIQVEDTGTGIPRAILDKIFDPFFTTKALGKGTGLGLSTSLAIIKSHGGFIHCYSELTQGTQFRIYLPAETKAAEQVPAAPKSELPRGNGETILVVDDEAAIREITRRTLERFGYRVMLAADGSEALTLYMAHRGAIDLVLTDMMMPVMDGPATIDALHAIDPNVRIVAASGLTIDGQARNVKRFLPKPYRAETLLRALKETLAENA
ncbi:MAG: PAS domain-containing hybrid sensor histidine kinase/response regulator [Vicinamibacterales bacterium]